MSLKEDPKKYILVTGTPRSGTTWVGKMLSANGTTGYIHEPFNHINARIHDSPIKYRHRYIDEKVELEQDGIFKKYLDYYFDPSWRFLFKSISKLSNVDSRYIVPFRQILRNFSDYPVSVIKDPFALLSAEWLHQTYNCEVVIVIRHPAAYALSMKQKEWMFSARVFQSQKELLDGDFAPLKTDILKYIKRKNHKYDLIGSAIIGWKVLHHQILLYRKKYPNWHFVRHEDLSVNPINYFQILYEKLNLDFTRKVSSAILKSTSGNGLEGNQRNAALNVAKWKKILSKKEIERIKKQTGDYYPLFYSENEW